LRHSAAAGARFFPKWCTSTDAHYQAAHGMTKTTVRGPISAVGSVARPRDVRFWHFSEMVDLADERPFLRAEPTCHSGRTTLGIGRSNRQITKEKSMRLRVPLS
jgi:hypothetical protein